MVTADLLTCETCQQGSKLTHNTTATSLFRTKGTISKLKGFTGAGITGEGWQLSWTYSADAEIGVHVTCEPFQSEIGCLKKDFEG